MIKVETVVEKEGTRVYVEANSDKDLEALDRLYEVIMSKSPKVAGYSSSLKFDVLLLPPSGFSSV